jgi:hypothetical protein
VALYARATNFVSAGIRDRKMRRPRGALKQREKLFSLNGQRPLSFPQARRRKNIFAMLSEAGSAKRPWDSETTGRRR